VPVGKPLHRGTQVAQHVPPVGHLDGLGSALAGPVGVSTGAVTSDHLDARMGAQPGREGLSLPVRQQVHHAVALEVDQDRAITVATTPRPVVYRENPRGARRSPASGAAHDQAQQRIGADGHGQVPGQACPRLAAERDAKFMVHRVEPLGPAREPQRNPAQGLSKGLPGTGRVAAVEPLDLDAQHHRAALRGQITEAALIAAMDAAGRGGTGGTAG
jgi:hypothetical protein